MTLYLHQIQTLMTTHDNRSFQFILITHILCHKSCTGCIVYPPLSLLVQWIFFFLFLSLGLLFPLKTLIWKNSISSYSDNVHHQVLLHIHVFGVRMSNFQEFVPEIFQDMWKSPQYVLMFMGIGELRYSWLIRNSKDHLILPQGFCFEKVYH